VKITRAVFLSHAGSPRDFPCLPHPEFAFIGRSNVGKSSLLNMVTGVKGLAGVGSRPGVTRSVHFFLINGNMILADMPGFGYARVPRTLRDSFLKLIRSYIGHRDTLRLVFLLVDIRRSPGDFEKEIIGLLSERRIPTAVIATKCDKVKLRERHESVARIASSLLVGADSIFITSTKKGYGRKEILSLLGEYSRKQGH
jgi:GTP-binding protein